MQDSIQENSSCQEFKEPVDEDRRKALGDEQDHVLEDEKKEKISDSNHEEDMGSIEQKQSSICVQESSTQIPVVAELKGDSLKISNVKLLRKSLVQLEETKWRLKTRAKNKLILNMKRI